MYASLQMSDRLVAHRSERLPLALLITVAWGLAGLAAFTLGAIYLPDFSASLTSLAI